MSTKTTTSKALVLAGVLAGCASVSFPAVAAVTADVTAEWDAPTEFADGSPMSIDQIEGYDLACTFEGDTVLQASLDNDATSYTETLQLEDGTYTCTLTTIGMQGRTSEVQAEFTVNPAPGEPQNFRTTISITFGG